MFKFRSKYLPILWPFVARNDIRIRYYLNGINVRPWGKGVLLAATDGHTLGLVFDTEGRADGEYTVQVSPQLVAASRRPRLPGHSKAVPGGAWVTAQAMPEIQPKPLDRNGRLIEQRAQKCARLSVVAGGDGWAGLNGEIYVQAGNALIDGKFPDVCRVIPARENIKPGAPDAYQVQYFDRLPKHRERSSWGRGVRFYYDGRERADGCDGTVLVCHLPDIPEFMALIMPYRQGATWADGRPDWLDLPAAAAGAAA